MLAIRRRQQSGATPAPRDLGPEWFRRMDRNFDGDVSWREFLGSAIGLRPARHRSRRPLEPRRGRASQIGRTLNWASFLIRPSVQSEICEQFLHKSPIFLVFLRRKKKETTTEKSARDEPALDACRKMEHGSVLSCHRQPGRGHLLS